MRITKGEVLILIEAYKVDLAGLKKEQDLAEKLEHHAHCVVLTNKIKLVENFISDLSKLIID